MIQKILSIFIVAAFVIIPVMAASSTLTLAGVAGSISLHKCNSLINADSGLPRFGGNTTTYIEDNSETDILTNGRTYVKYESKSDQSSNNFYASEVELATDYMGLAEDTAGMLNIQSNEPDSMCDQGDLTMGSSGESGRYPVSESYEGRTGAVFHDGGTYSSEVGLLDGDVHLQSEVYAKSKAIQYMNVHTTSMKGFNKNSSDLNMETYEDINYVGTTVDQETRKETTLDMPVEHNYGSYADAFADMLAEREYQDTQTVESISTERLDDFVNESSENETLNETPIEK